MLNGGCCKTLTENEHGERITYEWEFNGGESGRALKPNPDLADAQQLPVRTRIWRYPAWPLRRELNSL